MKYKKRRKRTYKPKLYIPGTMPMEIEWVSIKRIRENRFNR